MGSNVHENFRLILPMFIDSLKFYTDHVTEKVCNRYNRLSILIKLIYYDKTIINVIRMHKHYAVCRLVDKNR